MSVTAPVSLGLSRFWRGRMRLAGAVIVCLGLILFVHWWAVMFGPRVAQALGSYQGIHQDTLQLFFDRAGPRSAEWYLMQLQGWARGLELTGWMLIAYLGLALVRFSRRWCLAMVAAVGFGCIFLVGFDGLPIFDLSIMFDGAWRILQGQAPYRDVLFIAGLTLYAFQAAVFACCGVSLTSFMIGAGLINVALTLLSFQFVERLSGSRALATAAALIASLSSSFQMGFPWHAELACVCAVGALYGLLRAEEGPRRVPYLLAAGVCCTLSVFAKQNVGFVATGLAGALALAVRPRWSRTAWLGLGCAVSTAAVLAWIGIAADWRIFIEYFWMVPLKIGRLPVLTELPRMPAVWRPPYLLLVLSAGLLLLRAVRAKTVLDGRIVRFGLAVAALQWVSARSSMPWIFQLTGLLLGLAGAAQAVSLEQMGRVKDRLFAGVFVLALAYFALCGVTRWSLHYSFMPWGPRTYRVQEPRLRPLFMDAFHGPAMDEVIRYIKTEIPAEDPIVIFPEALLLYGITGRTSPLPLLWFHERLTYFPGDATDGRLAEALESRAVRWILLEKWSHMGGFMTPQHLANFPAFSQRIRDEFEPAAELKNYTVLRRREAGG